MKIDSLEQIDELKKQLEATKDQIKKYSLYNMDDIAEAITRVMTAFEGIEYIAIRYRFNLDEKRIYDIYLPYYKKNDKEDYPAIHIIPSSKMSEEYARYRLMHKRDLNDYNICYLPPAYYTPHKKCYYIKDFINFLYIKKVENNRNDKDFYLEIAEQFIKENQEEIEKRQQMIKIAYQKKLGPSPNRNELLYKHLYWM